MTTFDKALLFVVLGCNTCMCYMILDTLRNQECNVAPVVERVESVHLPSLCEPLLQQPDYAWAKCIGVGPK